MSESNRQKSEVFSVKCCLSRSLRVTGGLSDKLGLFCQVASGSLQSRYLETLPAVYELDAFRVPIFLEHRPSSTTEATDSEAIHYTVIGSLPINRMPLGRVHPCQPQCEGRSRKLERTHYLRYKHLDQDVQPTVSTVKLL